jgi:hypothetical protein
MPVNQLDTAIEPVLQIVEAVVEPAVRRGRGRPKGSKNKPKPAEPAENQEEKRK